VNLHQIITICTTFTALESLELCYTTHLNLIGSSRKYSRITSLIIEEFVKIKKLTLQSISLPINFSSYTLLTLPNLQYLIFDDIIPYNYNLDDWDSTENILFHPNNYPADLTILSPLKEFTCMSYNAIIQPVSQKK